MVGDASQLFHPCCTNQHINVNRPVLVDTRASVASHQPHRLPPTLGSTHFLQQAAQALGREPSLGGTVGAQSLCFDEIPLFSLQHTLKVKQSVSRNGLLM